MLKRFSICFLLLLLSFFLFSGCNKDLDPELIFVPLNNGQEYGVKAGTIPPDSKIIIPEYYNKKPVTTILAEGFDNSKNLIEITLPNTIISIEDKAFQSCNNLTSISISFGVTSIGDDAFQFCRSLTSITIPDSVTSLGNGVFFGCSSLISVALEEDSQLKSIGGSAFSFCYSLKSITFPASVTGIGDILFSYCSNLTTINVSENNENYKSLDGVLFNKELTELLQYPIGNSRTSYIIPDSVIIISQFSFYQCINLTCITIPAFVTNIELWAFRDCNSLTCVTFKDVSQLKSIGDYAFEGCKNLTSIIIPDSVTIIGNLTFYKCSSLESITLSKNITSIGVRAFFKCTSLTSIIISGSVTSIDHSVFEDCSNLTIFTIFNKRPEGWYYLWNGMFFEEKRPVVWGASLSEDETYVISINTEKIENTINYTLSNPYREGYNFDGWYTTNDFSGERYDTIGVAPDGILYVKWD